MSFNKKADFFFRKLYMMKIYSLQCPDFMDEKQFFSLIPLISPEKQRKIVRYRKPENAYQILWAELLIRALIRERTGLSNNQIVFGRNRFHKPFLCSDTSIHFNLSHSGNRILCALDTEPVGVDIERIQEIKPGLVELTLSSCERKKYNLMSPEIRLSYFFSIWTLKESYVKAMGTGLDNLASALSLHFFSSSQTAVVSQDGSPYQGYCRNYTVSTGYKAAACCFHNHFPGHIIKKDVKSVVQAFQ